MKNNIYIFGASGYIGKNLVKILSVEENVITVGRNHEDIFFDLNFSSYKQFLDLASPGDVFIFLAAISSPEMCEAESEFAFELNVFKTITLINGLTNYGVKVIFSSSDAVFGNKCHLAFDEDKLEPIGNYAVMKQKVENAVFDNNLVKVVRFSYVLGREDKFCRMLYDAASSETIVDVYNGFERNIVLLEDVLEGIKNLISKWDEFSFNVVNFSGPSLVSRHQLVKVLQKYVLPELRFELSEAPLNFWSSRARSIATDCKNFSIILGRKPREISSIKELW